MVTEQGPRSQLRSARMIASALPTGVVLFWIVGWFVTGGGEKGLQPDALSPRLAFWVWAAVAFCGFAAALVFRGRALEGGAGPRSPLGSGDAGGSNALVQANLIIAWGLLEGPALLAGVFFMLLASRQILSIAAALYVLGVVTTFPRAEWFRRG